MFGFNSKDKFIKEYKNIVIFCSVKSWIFFSQPFTNTNYDPQEFRAAASRCHLPGSDDLLR